jgi:hypothetical protein
LPLGFGLLLFQPRRHLRGVCGDPLAPFLDVFRRRGVKVSPPAGSRLRALRAELEKLVRPLCANVAESYEMLLIVSES